jgi:hypothetical protein
LGPWRATTVQAVSDRLVCFKQHAGGVFGTYVVQVVAAGEIKKGSNTAGSRRGGAVGGVSEAGSAR